MASSSVKKVYLCYGKNVLVLALAFILGPALAFAAGTDPTWSYALFGTAGKSGLQIARNGSQNEIYVTGSGKAYWIALRYNANTNDYDQIYVSSYYPSGISAIKVADVFKDGTPEIIVAAMDGNIQLFDLATKILERTISTQPNLYDIAVCDIDGDNLSEIILGVVRDSELAGHLYVYSPNGTLKWDLPEAGGFRIAVAQMDSDDALEIATSQSQIVDTATRSVQWRWPYSFGLKFITADIDGDGKAELIGDENWSYVYACDVDTQSFKRSINVNQNIGALAIADVDGDGHPELLVGQGQWGKIFAFDPVSRLQKWAIENPGPSVTNIAVGDVDGDGASELVWGAELSKAEGELFIANGNTGEIKWRNPDFGGPFVGPEIGDLDGDGRDEMVVASYDSNGGYSNGRIAVFDAADMRLRAISEPTLDHIVDLQLRDLNGDGEKEILITPNIAPYGMIWAYSFSVNNSFAPIWMNLPDVLVDSFTCVDAADIDGDNQMEIIGGSGGYVYVYNYTSDYGSLEWQSLNMHGDTVAAVAAADADQDGTQEIIALVKNGDVYIFDGASKKLEAMIMGPFTSMRVQSIDGVLSICLGNGTGDLHMYQYGSGTYNKVYSRKLISSSINGFTIDTDKKVWVSTADANSGSAILQEIALDGTELATYSGYGEVFGLRVAVSASSPYIYTAGSYSVNAFRRAGPQPDALNLGNSRFAATVEWRTPAGAIGVGHPVLLTSDSGYFWFFDSANVELLIKILDGRAVNGHFWVFYGALTDIQYLITITDTQTGVTKTYYGQQGSQTSANDIKAFTDTSGVSMMETAFDPLTEMKSFQAQTQLLGQSTASSIPPAPEPTALYLNNNRFEVRVSWSTLSGSTGVGTAMPMTADSGYFWFFGDTNVELLVKVLDGRGVNGHYWVFFGALTDVRYTLTIKDTQTGKIRIYEGQQGMQKSSNDITAFAD